MKTLNVVRRGRTVRLKAPEGTFSYFHPERLFTGFSWDSQTASLLLLRTPVRRVLLLGLGGGTVARQCRALFPRAELTGVEVDARVVETAYEHFGLGAAGVRVEVAPAEEFLRRTRRRFDAILDDVWTPTPGPKPLLSVRDWASLAASRLGVGGLYAANVYGRVARAPESRAAVARLAPHFAHLREVRPALGQTTVIAAGQSLLAASEAHARLRALPEEFAGGLGHLSFIDITTTARAKE
ncbi:MAG TPA: fused MFS/spermidine synthase [Pyrinomonadaceae bacterium]|nr:fused MFS/spermidine synthase [Pyrinomonadaceae bacterium]